MAKRVILPVSSNLPEATFDSCRIVTEWLTDTFDRTGSNAWWLAHLSNNDDIDIALSQVAKVWMAPYMIRPNEPADVEP